MSGHGQTATAREDAARDATVAPLTERDLPRLRLGPRARLTERDAASLLRAYPDRSVWVPATGEYALVAPWRHRPELPVIQALSAFRHEAALLRTLVARVRAAGAAALLMMDAEETRRPAFYDRYGLEVLEQIQTYELPAPGRALDRNGGARLHFQRVSSHATARLAALVALDHAAFPWLWWNSEAEFRAYLAIPEVEVWAGEDAGRLISYVGLTHFSGWGHLDRIAVAPAAQRAGYGRESMRFAVGRVAALGARRMGLSTQGDNARSQRLYESLGFRRTAEHDYAVRGVVFDRSRFRQRT